MWTTDLEPVMSSWVAIIFAYSALVSVSAHLTSTTIVSDQCRNFALAFVGRGRGWGRGETFSLEPRDL